MGDFKSRARCAETAMRQVFPATPLQRNAHLSERFGADIWLKREDLSPVRSYKLRGAYAFFSAALAVGDNAEFVCASAGNHAQGFAHACRHFGKNGLVFMPVTTPAQKIGKTRSFGGEWVDIRIWPLPFSCSRSSLNRRRRCRARWGSRPCSTSSTRTIPPRFANSI